MFPDCSSLDLSQRLPNCVEDSFAAPYISALSVYLSALSVYLSACCISLHFFVFSSCDWLTPFCHLLNCPDWSEVVLPCFWFFCFCFASYWLNQKVAALSFQLLWFYCSVFVSPHAFFTSWRKCCSVRLRTAGSRVEWSWRIFWLTWARWQQGWSRMMCLLTLAMGQ